MSEHYYVVGVHGPPTKETAPHGVRYLPCGEGNVWCVTATSSPGLKDPLTRWAPLPAPPTEEAPAREPSVARKIAEYVTTHHDFDSFVGERIAEEAVRVIIGDEAALRSVIAEARPEWADALNALDAHGVAWGPGRPMEELPDGHEDRVLIAYLDGVGSDVMHGTCREDDAQDLRACWWPLPGEAT